MYNQAALGENKTIKPFGLFGRHVQTEVRALDLTSVECSYYERVPSDWRPLDGDVYFAKPQNTNIVKIGKCGLGGAAKRIFALQLGCPQTLDLLGVIPGGGLLMEHEIQKRFAKYRVHREWFTLSDEIIEFIAKECR